MTQYHIDSTITWTVKNKLCRAAIDSFWGPMKFKSEVLYTEIPVRCMDIR
jgi:hypothetical protein